MIKYYSVSIFNKGIAHPKMEILSLFTDLQVVPNCTSFFLLLNTKEDILKNDGN